MFKKLTMSCVLKPSLEEITLAKISSTLWNQDDVKVLLENFNYITHSDKEWKKIEEIVVEKVQALSIPELLKRELSGFIRLMGCKIVEWMAHLHYKFDLERNKTTKFLWTQYGTIDNNKTAALLIKDQTLDLFKRSELARIHCLESDVQKVWKPLPEKSKISDVKTKNIFEVSIIENLLRFFMDMCNAPLIAFRKAVENNNKVTAEYYFHKLTPNEKEEYFKDALSIDRIFPGGEVLCFLLSQMREEQRKTAFRNNPSGFIYSLHYWPWINFYGEIVNHIWDSFSTVPRYISIIPLTILITYEKKKGTIEEAICQKLFTELWKSACKRFHFYADLHFILIVLPALFWEKDKKAIDMIFQDMSPELKKELILSEQGLCISAQLVVKNNQELLDFFIQQCLPSKQEERKYRKKLNPLRTIISYACKRKKIK